MMEKLIESINDPWSDIESFCKQHHGDQRHGDRAYIEHLREVVREVKRWQELIPADMLTTMIRAAYGHDLLEDTEASEDDVREVLGAEAFVLIQAVTDDPGPNRKTRKALTLPRTAKNRLAVFLKLCDRLANVRNSEKEPRFLNMYLKEHDLLRQHLYVPGEYDMLWGDIEKRLGYKP